MGTSNSVSLHAQLDAKKNGSNTCMTSIAFLFVCYINLKFQYGFRVYKTQYEVSRKEMRVYDEDKAHGYLVEKVLASYHKFCQNVISRHRYLFQSLCCSIHVATAYG